jgi:hypothetical protein
MVSTFPLAVGGQRVAPDEAERVLGGLEQWYVGRGATVPPPIPPAPPPPPPPAPSPTHPLLALLRARRRPH